MAVTQADARELLDEVLANTSDSADLDAKLKRLKDESDSAIERLHEAVTELQTLKS